MKVQFEQGRTYRVTLKLPPLVTREMVLAALRSDIDQVRVSTKGRTLLVVEARWKATSRSVDLDAIVQFEALYVKVPA